VRKLSNGAQRVGGDFAGAVVAGGEHFAQVAEVLNQFAASYSDWPEAFVLDLE